MTYGANDVIGIFIRSYDGDAKWLERTLPTHLRHAKPFAGPVVVGVDEQCRRVKEICAAHDVEFIPDPTSAMIANGYIAQQYSKLTAYTMVPWQWILYVDSDTECVRDVHFRELFHSFRAIMPYSEWDHVGGRVGGGDASCWFEPTRKALGFDPAHEYMRRLPILHHRDTVQRTHEHIVRHHGKSLVEYMAGVDAISEFNLLGAVAHEDTELHDYYEWICPETDPLPPSAWVQHWSHDPLPND